MKVIVTRGSGDNPSPDALVDVLCTTEQIGTLKGQAYLYDEGFDKFIIDLTVKIPRDIVCGDILEYFDPDYGTIHRGRIVGWNNACSAEDDGSITFTQTINVEKSIL